MLEVKVAGVEFPVPLMDHKPTVSNYPGISFDSFLNIHI
jgi:hypothetical protein